MRPPLSSRAVSDERWLVSYADFVTLLFAFFVMMYAITRSNESELTELTETLTATFELRPRALDPLQLGQPLLSPAPELVSLDERAERVDDEAGDTELRAAEPVQDRFDGVLGPEAATVAANADWLEISLSTELLFDAGSATLSRAAAGMLAEVADYLNGTSGPVTIEGFTDNVPSSGRYASNWELSGARAAAVARALTERGVDRRRLAAVGYGDNHPLATNATAEGRARNRRVNVVVARGSDRARNLNAGDSAFVARRREGEPELDPRIQTRRTADGGLLITAEPEDAGEE